MEREAGHSGLCKGNERWLPPYSVMTGIGMGRMGLAMTGQHAMDVTDVASNHAPHRYDCLRSYGCTERKKGKGEMDGSRESTGAVDVCGGKEAGHGSSSCHVRMAQRTCLNRQCTFGADGHGGDGDTELKVWSDRDTELKKRSDGGHHATPNLGGVAGRSIEGNGRAEGITHPRL